MTTTFKKSQNVLKIGIYHNGIPNKADASNEITVAIERATVLSCGKKQMVLTQRDSDFCLGRNFLPTEAQYGHGVVTPDLNDDRAAEAHAQTIGECYQANEIASLENIIARNTARNAEPVYLRIMNEKLALMRSATVRPFWHVRKFKY